MRRREFTTLLGGAAAAWPLATRAQERMRKVGVLMGIESDPDARTRVKAFRRRLGELGWSEDRNTRIDVIWGEGDADHVRVDVADLVAESPDVIVANGPVPTTEVGKATSAIPIVFVQVPDPVNLGIVSNLARPGGNITGFTHFELDFGGKWLEALKDMAPQTRRVLVISHADHPALPGFVRTIVGLECAPGAGQVEVSDLTG
jgi:putative tryptophan/tyrosine transport system substrate-binding protein